MPAYDQQGLTECLNVSSPIQTLNGSRRTAVPLADDTWYVMTSPDGSSSCPFKRSASSFNASWNGPKTDDTLILCNTVCAGLRSYR